MNCPHPEATLRTTTEVVAEATVTTCSTCGNEVERSVRERLRDNAAQARRDIEASPAWMRTPPTSPSTEAEALAASRAETEDLRLLLDVAEEAATQARAETAAAVAIVRELISHRRVSPETYRQAQALVADLTAAAQAHDAEIRLQERAEVYRQWHEERDPIVAEVARAAVEHERERYVLAGHKCRPVAVMTMKEGRDWWLGELTEPLADWPLETHCLHITTPLKSVVLGIMRADTDLLAVICRIVSGYIPTERWMDGLERSMRAQAQLRIEGISVNRDDAMPIKQARALLAQSPAASDE